MKKIIARVLTFSLLISSLNMNFTSAENQKPKEELKHEVSIKQERKELNAKRTETSKTYTNPDGTLTTETHQSAIHYMDSSTKKWEEIDNTLIESSDSQKVKNKKNSFEVNFSKQTGKGIPLLELNDGESAISLTINNTDGNTMNSSKSPAKVVKNKIIYNDAFDSTDLIYTVGTNKVKEDIILKSKPSPNKEVLYSFELNLKGLSYEEQKDGQILFKDKKTGKTLYYLEKPYMFDSYKPEGFNSVLGGSNPEGTISTNVEMNLYKKGNKLLIDIIPNMKWLMDDERVYPVTIDPTIVKYQPVKELIDTNIRGGLPSQTGGTDLELGAGLHKTSTSTNVIRSLLKFDIPDFPTGVRVINAELNLWASSVWNNNPIRVDLHSITSPWEENYATWNRRTSSTLWTTSGGSYNPNVLSSQTVGALGTSYDSNHYKWSVTPSLMEEILKNPKQNMGFLLKSSSEGTASYKKFYSGDYLDMATYSPLLSITYVSNSRLGMEDYWTYNTLDFANGNVNVNLGTGNGVVQLMDIAVGNKGNSGLSFLRTYNTKASEIDAFGPGWSFTGSESITEQTSDKSITYTDADGTVHVFIYNPSSGTYQTPQGTYLT